MHAITAKKKNLMNFMFSLYFKLFAIITSIILLISKKSKKNDSFYNNCRSKRMRLCFLLLCLFALISNASQQSKGDINKPKVVRSKKYDDLKALITEANVKPIVASNSSALITENEVAVELIVKKSAIYLQNRLYRAQVFCSLPAATLRKIKENLANQAR